jgi:hypothetical protein
VSLFAPWYSGDDDSDDGGGPSAWIQATLSVKLNSSPLSLADFGYAHLSTLIKSCNFPWLLSNIVDTNTGKQPDVVQKFVVFQKMGVRIGVIGLVEK